MIYYAVFLPLLDLEKSQKYRPQHLDYLEQKRDEGKIFVNGPFVDGTGGLFIYQVSSLEEVKEIVQNDPYVLKGARGFEIHEWAMVGL